MHEALSFVGSITFFFPFAFPPSCDTPCILCTTWKRGSSDRALSELLHVPVRSPTLQVSPLHFTVRRRSSAGAALPDLSRKGCHTGARQDTVLEQESRVMEEASPVAPLFGYLMPHDGCPTDPADILARKTIGGEGNRHYVYHTCGAVRISCCVISLLPFEGITCAVLALAMRFERVRRVPPVRPNHITGRQKFKKLKKKVNFASKANILARFGQEELMAAIVNKDPIRAEKEGGGFGIARENTRQRY